MKIYIICLRVLLTLLCAVIMAWIFSNSLRTGESSSAQSAGVVEVVQEVASVIAPTSPVATATGEDYERLHAVIRAIAHFSEFAVLGGMLVLCWRSYTRKKAWIALPAGCICATPIVDELLQSFTAGRAMEFTDILTDIAGGVCGGVCALLFLWVLFVIVAKIQKKRGRSHGARELGDSVNQIQ